MCVCVWVWLIFFPFIVLKSVIKVVFYIILCRFSNLRFGLNSWFGRLKSAEVCCWIGQIKLAKMVFDSALLLGKLGGNSLGTSEYSSIVSMNLFVALLCACIVIGHLLEENRWMNESITALLIVSCVCACATN